MNILNYILKNQYVSFYQLGASEFFNKKNLEEDTSAIQLCLLNSAFE